MKPPTVRALSLYQPYAHAVIHDIKGVDNRNWPTDYVGPVLIHAHTSKRSLKAVEYPCGTPVPDIDFPRGCLIGAVTIVDCVEYESCVSDDPPGRYPKAYRDWLSIEPHATGPFCLFLDKPVAFATPIPYPGETGLFRVPISLLPAKAVRYVRKAIAACTPDTTVVNVRSDEYDVYIGRACYGRKGSMFGNPYKGPGAVSAYKAWFEEKVKHDPIFRHEALALRGKRLACWCAEPGFPLTADDKPFVCHGQILAEWVESQPV